MSDVLELRVNNRAYNGFLSGTVTQALDSFASVWRLKYATETTLSGELASIQNGDGVSLAVSGEELFEGFVDTDDDEWGPKTRSLKVNGRSNLGDLMDCSSVGPKRWTDASILKIASDLTKEYSVEVEGRDVDADKPFRKFAIEEGEKIAETLLRAAKLRGLVLVDEGGKLVIARAGQRRSLTDLRQGVNLLHGRRRRSMRERYSAYEFKGQTRATDEAYGLDAADLSGSIEDPEVERFRRLVVTSWGDENENLRVRAVNERNTRAGRGYRLIYDVKGWRDDAGDLWRPNTRVNVFDHKFKVSATMLITRTSLVLDGKSHKTTLELARPEAYDLVVNYPVTPRGETVR